MFGTSERHGASKLANRQKYNKRTHGTEQNRIAAKAKAIAIAKHQQQQQEKIIYKIVR